MLLKDPVLFYTRMALFMGARRSLLATILRVNLTLLLSLFAGLPSSESRNFGCLYLDE